MSDRISSAAEDRDDALWENTLMDGLEDDPYSEAAGSHCGHDPARFVTGGDGTAYCPACEQAAQASRAERELEDPQARKELGSSGG